MNTKSNAKMSQKLRQCIYCSSVQSTSVAWGMAKGIQIRDLSFIQENRKSLQLKQGSIISPAFSSSDANYRWASLSK
jgi:hypothetical protein